jgi:hypothetical protein
MEGPIRISAGCSPACFTNWNGWTQLAGIDAGLCEEFLPHEDLLRRLCTIPGVDKTTARVIVAELGTDMQQFPSAARVAAWAGLCPGNSESAGQRFSGRTRKGDRYLRRILVQSGWAAARTRDCFLAALFNRIAHRRGFKKAVSGSSEQRAAKTCFSLEIERPQLPTGYLSAIEFKGRLESSRACSAGFDSACCHALQELRECKVQLHALLFPLGSRTAPIAG